MHTNKNTAIKMLEAIKSDSDTGNFAREQISEVINKK